MVEGAVTHRQRRGQLPVASAAGLAVAAAPLTWWAIGPLGTQRPDHNFGPYHFSASLLYTLGGISIAVAIAAVLFAAAPRSHREGSVVSAWTALLLIVPGVLLAAAWRVATAGSVGADIGGGMAFFTVPVLVAAALVGAVAVESAHRRQRLKHRGLLIAATILTAPALYAAA